MATWKDYKDHVRESNPEIGKDLNEIEAVSQIVGAIVEHGNDVSLSLKMHADELEEYSTELFYSETNTSRLEESEQQYREGKVVIKTMEELESMAKG